MLPPLRKKLLDFIVCGTRSLLYDKNPMVLPTGTLTQSLLSVNEYLYNVSNVKSLGDIFCCRTPKLIVAAFLKNTVAL